MKLKLKLFLLPMLCACAAINVAAVNPSDGSAAGSESGIAAGNESGSESGSDTSSCCSVPSSGPTEEEEMQRLEEITQVDIANMFSAVEKEYKEDARIPEYKTLNDRFKDLLQYLQPVSIDEAKNVRMKIWTYDIYPGEYSFWMPSRRLHWGVLVEESDCIYFPTNEGVEVILPTASTVIKILYENREFGLTSGGLEKFINALLDQKNWSMREKNVASQGEMKQGSYLDIRYKVRSFAAYVAYLKNALRADDSNPEAPLDTSAFYDFGEWEDGLSPMWKAIGAGVEEINDHFEESIYTTRYMRKSKGI